MFVDFVGNKKKFFLFTLCFVVLGILCFFIRGFNWDVDFAGGTEMTVKVGVKADKDVQKEIEDLIAPDLGSKFSSVTSTGSTGDEVLIRANELSSEEREEVFNKLAEKYDLDQSALLETSNVSGAISGSLRKSAIIATTIAVILMLIYIAIRFEFLSAVAAVICLIHDIFFVLVAYSVLQLPINSNIIAVALTILGYSINATIIIFDRIRENNKLMSGADFAAKVNKSVNSTMKRSLYTTITTLLTIGMVYILGVTSIKQFALPLIVGIIVGLYSSVCLAGNLWCTFKTGAEAKKTK